MADREIDHEHCEACTSGAALKDLISVLRLSAADVLLAVSHSAKSEPSTPIQAYLARSLISDDLGMLSESQLCPRVLSGRPSMRPELCAQGIYRWVIHRSTP